MPRLALALAALALAACGSAAGSGGLADLAGRTFLSTVVTDGGRPKPLADGTRIRLSFDGAGRIGANAGCNHMGGTARIEGGRLVVGDLATTAMACGAPRDEQDAWLSTLLKERPTVLLNGNELVLVRGSTELRLLDRRVADPDRPLAGPRWVVESIVDRDVASSTPQGAEAHVTFAADGTLRGSTGCNEMGGSYAPSGNTLRFSGVFATKRACDPAVMRLETTVLDVLRGDATFEIAADVLRLRTSTGKGLDLRAR